MLKRKTIVVGPFQCNCTLLYCDQTNEGILIDAGDEASRIEKMVGDTGIKIKYSIHTHAHLDHIGAVSELKQLHPTTKIALHKADEWLYQNLPMQGQMFGLQYTTPPTVDHFLNHEENLQFGQNYQCSVVHTPGHSPGGICLHFKEGMLSALPEIFAGDTLFDHSVGRTDLWMADHRQLIGSIKDRLLTLDDATLVHPGHGTSSKIAVEARENPFLV